MNTKKVLLGAVGALILTVSAAGAAGIYPGFPLNSASPLTNPPTGNEVIAADTGLPSGENPATALYPLSVLGNFSGTPKNYLDNGAMAVQQYGTGIITCAVNAGQSVTTHPADRWGCTGNVGSATGRGQIVTATPAPPVGFPASMKIYRNSAALTQPICAIQEIPTVRSTYLAGKTVTFSVLEQALAGLSADNGNNTTLTIIYGTGTDEGLGTMTASPAITPAWTGITSLVNQQAFTITTAWTRIAVTATIPTTATEVGVELCFTPTATGAGTTDGFAFAGAQLEVAASPTAFEFRPYEDELRTAQRYFWRVTESATVISRRDSGCAVSSSSLAVCQINFPTQMRIAPTMTYTAGFTLTVAAQTSAVVCTATRTSTTLTGAASNTQGVPIDCTSSAGFGGAGTAAQLYDLGTGSSTGIINAYADF